MNKINKLLEEFNGQTFASNEDVTEHLRIAIKHLLVEEYKRGFNDCLKEQKLTGEKYQNLHL